MPLFEYRCEKCGAKFEQVINAGSTPSCPKCDGTAVTKLLSAFSVGRGGRAASSAPCPPAGGG